MEHLTVRWLPTTAFIHADNNGSSKQITVRDVQAHNPLWFITPPRNGNNPFLEESFFILNQIHLSPVIVLLADLMHGLRK